MSGSKGGIPDAWDDDWERAADKPEPTPSEPGPAPKLSKAAKKAQHIEQQKQLWDSADNPGRSYWLEAQGVVPLKQDFKPPVTLLSRKPPALAKKDAADDDDDSEDERRRKREAEFEERQRKAKIEREEKQRRYAEARERIMGSSNPSPSSNSRESSQGRDSRRPRGAVKSSGNRRSRPHTPAEQSPSRSANIDGNVFDPEDMGRRLTPKREPSSTTPREDHPLRQPRGPDQSGRGGFGFASRGGRAIS